MIKNFTCIVCPVGCNIEAELKDGEVKNIGGYACKRGREYGISECLNPVRTLTTTVFAGEGKMLPVKTSQPVPKGKLFDCMAVINETTTELPVQIGSVVIKNICGTGIDVVAAKSMR